MIAIDIGPRNRRRAICPPTRWSRDGRVAVVVVDDWHSSDQKVVQYLSEAFASEIVLVNVLRSQIAITPRGSYRDAPISLL
jgi:hypothetical protein